MVSQLAPFYNLLGSVDSNADGAGVYCWSWPPATHETV